MKLIRSFSLFAALGLSSTIACGGAEPDEADTQASDDSLVEAKHLGVSDVTILYPLPSGRLGETVDDLLAASSEGDRGELLPPAIFDQIASAESPPMLQRDGTTTPVAAPVLGRRADMLADLRVVGIRLDPCFGETTNLGAASCQNNIRLVAQFVQNTSGNTIADAAVGIHLFYSLNRTEFTALSKAMLGLRRKAGLALQKGFQSTYRASSQEWFQLGVHPTLAVQGLRGEYATSLRDLILSYAGEQNLTQVAFCVQDRGPETPAYYHPTANLDNRWVFGRFGVRQGSTYPMDVPSLNYTGLQWVDTLTSVPTVPGSNPPRLARDVVVANPAPQTTDNFMKIFNNRESGFDPAPSRLAAYRFRNPKYHTANNTDCVSCHMADSAVARGGQTRNPDPSPFRSSTYRLNASPDGLAPFRLFGYGPSGQPVVATRVVNETAVVLDYLNRFVLR